MPDNVIIDVKNVTKRFGRRHPVPALSDVTVSIERGQVAAVVGPNGAGKSTLFSIILGFLHADSGDVTISGLDPRHYVSDHGVGYVPDRFSLPASWPVGRAIDATAAMGGVSAQDIGDAERAFGIADQRSKKIGALSRGLLQRVGLAIAFGANRDLIVLDEPAEALDPLWRIRLREMIIEQRARGRTILFASHDLNEVERLADVVFVLDRGSVRETIGIGARDDAHDVYTLTLSAPSPHVATVFADAAALSDNTYRIRADGVGDLNSRIAALIDLGASITALHPESTKLEDHVRRTMQE